MVVPRPRELLHGSDGVALAEGVGAVVVGLALGGQTQHAPVGRFALGLGHGAPGAPDLAEGRLGLRLHQAQIADVEVEVSAHAIVVGIVAGAKPHTDQELVHGRVILHAARVARRLADLHGEPWGHVRLQRRPGLSAAGELRQYVFHGPPRGLARDLAGRARRARARSEAPRSGDEHIAAEHPVGVDQVLGGIPVNRLQPPEERVRPLGADLGEEGEGLAPRRLRLRIGPRREANDLAAREDRGGQRADTVQDEDHHRAVGRFLQGLEESVGRVVGHPVRAVDDEDLACGLAGRSAAWRSSALMSPMRMARGPLGFRSGGVGTTRCRSGCRRVATRAQARHRPHPPPRRAARRAAPPRTSARRRCARDRGGPTKA